MKEYYFTFGQTHVHSVNGFTFDKDVVVMIKSTSYDTARAIMIAYFGYKWAMQYDHTPNMFYFPRGIVLFP